MFKTPPQNKSVASTEDSNKGTNKAETSAGKDKGITSHVRKSVGELESRLGAAPKTKTAALPTKQRSKVPPAVECDENQMDIETTKYLNRAQEAKAHVVKIKLLLNSSRNLKTEIKDKITEAADKLYRLTKVVEEEKENTMENEGTNLERKLEIEYELVRKMEEHSKLLKECRTETQRLSEEVKSHREELVTYASVAAKRNRGQALEPNVAHLRDTIPVQMHSIIVRSENEKDTSGDVIEKIRVAVNAKQSGLKVEKVRKAKDQKVIVGCGTREEMEKVTNRIKVGDTGLSIEQTKNKDPLVILRNVLTINTDDDITAAIRSQNKNLMECLKSEEVRLSVRYRMKTRNPHTNHVVLQVSPPVWNRLTEAGRVHVDLQRVVVADQSPLMQCSRCLAYGHGKKHCKEPDDKCSHCGGPHLKISCTAFPAGKVPSCINCVKAKMDRQDHNAFDNECPVRRRWDAIARASVAYC